eukprot:1184567-Prorocentrum_minimum.AAC.7
MVRNITKKYAHINNLSKEEKKSLRISTSHKINMWSTRHDRGSLRNTNILASLLRRLELFYASLGDDEDEDEDAYEDAHEIIRNYARQLDSVEDFDSTREGGREDAMGTPTRKVDSSTEQQS